MISSANIQQFIKTVQLFVLRNLFVYVYVRSEMRVRGISTRRLINVRVAPGNRSWDMNQVTRVTLRAKSVRACVLFVRGIKVCVCVCEGVRGNEPRGERMSL